VTDHDKRHVAEVARKFVDMGFKLVATAGTADVIEAAGMNVERVYKVKEGRPNVVDFIKGQRIQLIVNTPTGLEPWFDEKAIRRAAVTARIPTITTLAAVHGIFPPITTPFYPDGKIYFRKLEQNVEQYSRGPIAGIVVQGSTGEAILLSDDERRDVLKCARDSAANEKVLIAGTGIESAIETLRLTEYAAELGYDIAMVRTPHYYKGQMAQPANMLAFYRFVCDRSPLPVIIYNFPQATGYDIPAEIVIELAEHPNLIGIKESSGSIEKVQKMVAGTRHIKRSATVTETFAAATGAC
jgi:hypothetical protein